MDLDFLDNLIKKRRQTKPQPKKQFGKTDKIKPLKSRLAVQSKGGKVTKPNQSQQRGGINAQLSTSTHSGPLFTAKNQQQQQQQTQKTDPSQIIITKAFAPGSVQSRIGSGSNNNKRGLNTNLSSRLSTTENNNNNNNNTHSILHGRLGTQQTSHVQRVETTSFTKSASAAAAAAPSSKASLPNFSIRGQSNTVKPSTGMAISGESGPTLLLITGLDMYANSEDLETSLEQFGHILSCEVLRNCEGRSYGEAEVEFSTRKAAMDCIAKLDNQMANGRILRVILRETNKYNAPKPVQSVISSSSSRNASGKMYADQMSSRYDIRRQ
ncbi:unnamed protein product [Mucor hiemalis]